MITAEYLAQHAQAAFEDACPEDASPYEIGKAWQKVGEHLAAVIAENQAEARSVEPTLNEIRAAIEPYVRLAGGWVYSDAFTDSDDEMVTAVGIRLGAHRALVALSEALPTPPKAEADHG